MAQLLLILATQIRVYASVTGAIIVERNVSHQWALAESFVGYVSHGSGFFTLTAPFCKTPATFGRRGVIIAPLAGAATPHLQCYPWAPNLEQTMAVKKKGADFEQSLNALETLVNKMEQGDMTLEESLKAFETGIQLTRECQARLAAAEQQVQKLVENQGVVSLEPFDPQGNDE